MADFDDDLLAGYTQEVRIVVLHRDDDESSTRYIQRFVLLTFLL